MAHGEQNKMVKMQKERKLGKVRASEQGLTFYIRHEKHDRS